MPDWSYYPVFRPLLAALPPQSARTLTLRAMGWFAGLPGGTRVIEFLGHMDAPADGNVQALGLDFPGRLGLGAGMDPDGHALKALSVFGFGYLEAGPVTVAPQAGASVARRDYAAKSLVYADLPVNSGLDALAHRLESLGPLAVPLGIRLAHRPGTEGHEAASEVRAMIARLAPSAQFLTLDARWGPLASDCAECREIYLAAAKEAVQATGKDIPVLLCLPSDMAPDEMARVGDAALAHGIRGVVIAGGVRAEGGWITGKATHAQSCAAVRAARHRWGDTITIIGSGGTVEPADAVALIEAGADFVQIASGLTFSGPGLPKRINEALSWRRSSKRSGMETASSTGVKIDVSLMREGWFWILLLGLGMFFGGILAAYVALTTVVLPYDEHFVGMSRPMMATMNPHLMPFMEHDRVSLAGVMMSIGVLYGGLAYFGIRPGAHWARRAVLISATVGFSSLFLFLGYGYFDPLHAFVTALLLPLFLLGLRKSPVHAPVFPAADLYDNRVWLRGVWGQFLFVLLGIGITGAGLAITVVGVTHVFVPQDLMFLHASPAAIRAAHPHLIPVIAHDRAGFGGALVSDGLAVLLLSLWGMRAGAKWVWWTLLLSGLPGFAAALGIHYVIGYLNFVHLAPGFLALGLYIVALSLCYPYLCGFRNDGAKTLTPARSSPPLSQSERGQSS